MAPAREAPSLLGSVPLTIKPPIRTLSPVANEPPGREVEHLRPHCRELRIFQMNRNGVDKHESQRLARVLIAEDHFISGVQAHQLSERGNVGCSIDRQIVIHEVIQRCVLIDATANWAPTGFAGSSKFHTSVAVFAFKSTCTSEDSNSHVALPVASWNQLSCPLSKSNRF